MAAAMLMAVAFMSACEERSDADHPAAAADSVPVGLWPIDTTGVARSIEDDAVEIETRLRKLLTAIEAKEKDLARREQRLAAERADLESLDARLWVQRLLSWIALAVGIIAAFLGIRAHMGRGRDNSPTIGDEAPKRARAGTKRKSKKSSPGDTGDK